MSHSLLAPSAAHRWLICTPSARLEAELPESTSEYAEEGTHAHKVCELIARKRYTVMSQRTYNANLKKLRDDPLYNPEMLTTATAYADHLAEADMQFKGTPYVALEVSVDVSDWVPEARGTCDCVIIGDDELIITDYKHGKGVPVSAEENPQMMLYALGALKLYQPIYGDAIRRVTLHIDQPRLGSYSSYSLTVEELLAWGESTVKPKAQAAYAGLGEYTPGEWCRFCRAKAQCRARAGAQTALEDFKDAVLCDSPEYMANLAQYYAQADVVAPPLVTDTEIGDLLTRGEQLVDWYNSLREYALSALLAGRAIPGWKAVEGRSVRAWSDQDKALELIQVAGHQVYETVPKSLAQLEKQIGLKPFEALVGSLITRPPGKPALAPESDSRPAYSGAVADFAGVAE